MVLQRLKTLSELEVELQQSDPYDQLLNVQALLSAYREKRLNWNEGLVTYWFLGEKLCEPRPFKWDECEILSAQHVVRKGNWMAGFWMEGVSPLKVSNEEA